MNHEDKSNSQTTPLKKSQSRSGVFQGYRYSVTVGFIGLAVSLVMFFLVMNWEHNLRRLDFDRLAEARCSSFKSEVEHLLDELQAVERFYYGSQFVSYDEFVEFVTPEFDEHSGLRAFGWAPCVTGKDRSSFEQAMKRDGRANHVIHEGKNSNGELIIAGQREEYYPVLYRVPQLDWVIGKDLLSEPIRRKAVEQARDMGQFAATAPIFLENDRKNAPGIVAFLPVYKKGLPVSTIEERRAATMGILLCGMRINDVLEGIIKNMKPIGINVLLTDISTSGDERFLGQHLARLSVQTDTLLKVNNNSGLLFETSFDIANRTWEMRCSPSSGYLAAHTIWVHWVILLGGLALTILLVLFFRSRQNRTAIVEALFHERSTQLRESEKNFRDIASNTPIGLIISDKEGKILFANERFSEITGYDVDELIGNNGLERLTRQQDKGKYGQRMKKRVTSEPHDKKYERVIVRKDGKEIQTEFFTTMTRWKGMDCPMALVQDITDRKWAEEALREKTIMLDNILRSANDMAIVTTDLDFRITYFNPIAEKLYGYKARDVIGKSVQEMHTLENVKPERFEKAIVSVHEKGEYSFPLRQKREDGIRFIECHMSGIADPEGIMVGYSLFSRDITKRMQTQEILEESEEKYRQLVENANSIILRWDRNGRITFFNEFAQKFFGYTEEEILGRHVIGTITPEEESTGRDLRSLMNNICSNPEKYTYNVNENMRKNGERVWIAWTNKIVKDKDGNTSEALSIGTDITERKLAEKALEKSEERFRRITDTITDYIYTVRIKDGQPAETVHGQACKAVTGYSSEEFKNNPYLWIQMIPEEDHELVRDQTSHILSNDTPPKPIEHRLIHKDGSIRWVTSSLVANRDAQGNLLSYDGLVSDITKRKIAEIELKKSRDEYELIFNNMQDVLYRTNIEGNLILISPSGVKLLGYDSVDQMIGLNIAKDFYAIPENRDKFLELLREKGKVDNYEVILKRMDGALITVIVSSHYYHDAEGNIVGVEGVFTDITERKKAEADHVRLMSAIEQANETIVITDTEGTIQYANPAFERITGYSLMEAIGQNPRILKSDKHDDAFYKEMWETLLRGEEWHGQLINKKKDGTLYTEEVTISPVRDTNGVTVNYVGVKHDITELERLRELESRAQRLETAGTIAGQIAHDFNNLLAPLMAYPEFIRDELPGNHAALPYLRNMEKAAEQIADINQQLLTLGRRGHYNQDPLNLNEIVMQALKEIEPLPDTLACEIDLEEELMNMAGGGAQIHRILSNLLHNARDAMQDIGQITVKTENYYVDEMSVAYGRVPKGEYVKLTISDTGCGIPDDIIQKIFDPFFSSKSTDRKRGSGLGLSVVHAVVHDHSGYIDLNSKVGEGTSFYLYFPVTRDSVQDTGSDSCPEGHESILVVDDDEVQRDVSSKLLKKLGYNVTIAESGEKAAEILKEKKQDLLVLDMVMPPGIDGVETYKRAIEINPDQKAIIVSGFSETGKVLAVQKLGAGAFVKKPLTRKSIATTVRKELDKKAKAKTEQEA
ncbi:MAG: hypothetical protein DRP47_07095 [Candidatus Zixiibacteriota bacterium]|nr:MAG: hypothetical protein DRP47_07095 [candidate division Zixibacteria bacterium]